ncbi:MAG: ATP-binding protein [Caldimonas sp.]
MSDSPTMSPSTIEPDRCAAEPIHVPGSIQPHGALLVVAPGDFRLLQASSNAAELLGAALEPGGSWPADSPLVEALRQTLAEPGLPAAGGAVRTLHGAARSLSLVVHSSPQGLLVELEPHEEAQSQTFDSMFPRIRAFVERVASAEDLEALAHLAATEVRQVTGFHRVLVYRFNPEWHGTVIAEDGDGTLPSYLGLRFPASDIPAQARELYRRNRLRLIPNALYSPVPMLPAASPIDGFALDLSGAALRSVSPVHLEYMRNMGTAASMSISILVDGALWGLISCHHAEPRTLGPKLRGTCDFIGQIVSIQIGERERAARAHERLALKGVEAELLARVAQAPSLQSGLGQNAGTWLRLAGADGAAILQEGAVLTCGRTPSVDELGALAAWLRHEHADQVFVSAELARDCPAAAAFSASACGLLAVPISALHPHFILWFRGELVETVRWGGEPDSKAFDAQGGLHPRHSFAQWTQEVRGRAEPWTEAQVETAESFRNAIVTFVLKRAEERAQLTGRLEASNKELEAFSYSVSHDLRAPFRHVVGYAQLLREQDLPFDERSCHYIDSIIESALAAGQLVDDLLTFSQLGRSSLDLTRVDMNKLIAECRRSIELDVSDRRIEWQIDALPVAWADATLMRQALVNLIENAVKYTRGRDPARIEITGEERGHELVYAIRDNGVGFDMTYVGKLFGVFQRLHRVEDFEGTGIGLALVRRIVDRQGGWIAAEGRLNEGAVFRIGLPKPAQELAR